MKTKRNETNCVCPRCGYRLSPVFLRKDSARRPVAYCCPEPYCDFSEVVRPSVLGWAGRARLRLAPGFGEPPYSATQGA